MKDLTELTLTDLWKEVKEDFWGEISLGTQKMVKRLMEVTLEEEMAAYIGIGRYGRSESRRDYLMAITQEVYLPHLGIYLR